MAWQVILPIAANLIQGAISGGMQARAAGRENNRQRLAARMRRSELQPIIDRLSQARDYFGVEEQFVRDFSRSADQMAAQSSQSGMTNAGRGGLDQLRRDELGTGLAALAQYKTQNEMARQQMLAQILSDPSLYAGVGEADNVGAQTLWGALGGGAAGVGSALTAFLGTEEGMAALGSMFGAQAPQTGTMNVDAGTPALPTRGSWLAGQAPTPAHAIAAPAPTMYSPNPYYGQR